MYLTYDELKEYIIKLQKQNKKHYDELNYNPNNITYESEMNTSRDLNLQLLSEEVLLRLCDDGILTGVKPRVKYYKRYYRVFYYRIITLVSRNRSHRRAYIYPVYYGSPEYKKLLKQHMFSPKIIALTRDVYRNT